MAIIRKSEQKRPKMALNVVPNFASFLTKKPYNKSQIHVNKDRTVKKIKEYFYTFNYLYESDLLDQAYKDKLFPRRMVSDFISLFSSWDYEHSEIEEQVKLQISIKMIWNGLSYLEHRYKEVALIKNQAFEFKELLNTIEELTRTKVEDRKAIEFYRMRSFRTLPPDLKGDKQLYVVMCKICWNHYTHQDKKQAINHIHHSKNCLYDKSQISRCIEVISPKNTEKKQ